jgi:hypothetical protein
MGIQWMIQLLQSIQNCSQVFSQRSHYGAFKPIPVLGKHALLHCLSESQQLTNAQVYNLGKNALILVIHCHQSSVCCLVVRATPSSHSGFSTCVNSFKDIRLCTDEDHEHMHQDSNQPDLQTYKYLKVLRSSAMLRSTSGFVIS